MYFCCSVFSDYMIAEVYVLYIALLYHTVVWALVLRLVDTAKDGGRVMDLLCSR